MKTTLLFAALMSLAFAVSAQKTYVWKGGKPGRANDWNCPANWSTYRVPDEFADVVVPIDKSDSHLYPEIRGKGFEVNTMRISCGAKVTITEHGSLAILNPDYCEDVSRIIVYGKLELPGRGFVPQDNIVASRTQK
jgi:hypothetical protein